LNPGRRGRKPATNRLSYGAAFRTVSEIALFHRTAPKLLIRKGYFVPVFIVPSDKVGTVYLVYNTFSKILPSRSMHFATRVRAAYSAYVKMCGFYFSQPSYNVTKSHNGSQAKG
jgi:hypothetical protein